MKQSGTSKALLKEAVMLKRFTVYSSVYPEHFKACENRNRPVWEKLFSWEEEFAVELKDY